MYTVDRPTGRVREARQIDSPNQDERPAGCVPELLVVHGISLPPGEFGGPFIDQLFTNCLPAEGHPYFAAVCTMQVSAHFLIRRDGELVQYVPVTARAWHAGPSCFNGRERCNDFSVGIELEGEDTIPYTDAQYGTLAQLVQSLRSAWPSLATAPVVGHSDIAPGRKSDPGPAFDWARLQALLGHAAE